MLNTSTIDPKVTFEEPQSSREGVFFHMAEFQNFNKEKMPFKGGKFIVGPQRTSKEDVHEVKECWFIAQGKGILTYNGEEFSIEAGNFLFFEPFKKHQVFNPSEQEDLVIHTIWWL